MPLLSERDLIVAVTRDRAAGKRIAFVPLGFDLLRVTHVRTIQAAAAGADRVIVAVVDDGGFHATKAEDRAELVDGFRGVDYVVVCRSGDVERLAALVGPDLRA